MSFIVQKQLDNETYISFQFRLIKNRLTFPSYSIFEKRFHIFLPCNTLHRMNKMKQSPDYTDAILHQITAFTLLRSSHFNKFMKDCFGKWCKVFAASALKKFLSPRKIFHEKQMKIIVLMWMYLLYFSIKIWCKTKKDYLTNTILIYLLSFSTSFPPSLLSALALNLL